MDWIVVTTCLLGIEYFRPNSHLASTLELLKEIAILQFLYLEIGTPYSQPPIDSA